MLLPDNERARRFVAAVSAKFALQPLHQHQHHTAATAVAAAEAAAAEAQGANPSKNTTHASAVVAAGSYATYGAPITAAIHAYVEDIASGAAEVELRQAAATTAQFLHLPARRSRTCEDKLAHAPQQQAIASAAAVIHVGAGSGGGGNGAGSGSAAVSAINAVAHASFDSLSGPKMLAAAVAAMTSNFVGGDDNDSAGDHSTAERDDDDDRSLFSAEEAVCALTARAMN
jgi:hypothetical protein